ncbi:MAG: D-sedoheptulose 7-phosphate isomerase [Candidatus Omnitrophota bacterium]
MMRDKIKDMLLENIRVKEEMLRTSITQVMKIAELLVECLKKNGKVIIFGNGGSASDSQHIAAELVGRFKKERQGLPAVALTANTSVLTALANDYGYEAVFSRQIEALAGKNDLAIGISTSGKARNVAAAIKQAAKMGLKTVVLTGSSGAELAKLADAALIVPSNSTPRIQETHITIGHIICEIAEDTIFQD